MAEIPVYGCAMHKAIAKGDVDEMRTLVNEAKEHLRTYGNVPFVLEVLRSEIAKVEASEQGRSGSE